MRTALIAAAIVGLIAAGCGWAQYGHDGSRAGWSPADKLLDTTNVGQLVPRWETAAMTAYGAQIADDTLFSIDLGTTTRLLAFKADGTVGCSGTPRRCTPLWTAPLSTSMFSEDARHGAYAVVGHRVYVTGFTPLSPGGEWRLEVFDADGKEGCGGAPKACAPLWRATWGAADFDGAATLAVANGKVYVSTPALPDGITVFDAAGKSRCSHGSHVTCQPLFSTTSTGGGAIAVDDQHLLVRVGAGLAVFDAQGVTGCANRVCSPLRTITELRGPPSVSGGVAFALFSARDLSTTSGCSGAPQTCPPSWTMAVPGAVDVAYPIAAGRVLLPEGTLTGNVEAFDAHGQEGCTGSPLVCNAVRRYVTGRNPVGVSANGELVFVASDATGQQSAAVMGFDLDGTAGCSGSPASCTPLWTAPLDTNAVGFLDPPAVAGGLVAVSGNNGALRVFGLPG